MDVKGFLTELKQQRWYGDQIVYTCHLPARVAEYAVPLTALADELTAALRSQGIERLYSHQVEALDRLGEGENVVIVTGTASGKTLCYNLPVVNHLLATDNTARALYLYPTKALAEDQLSALRRLRDSHPAIKEALWPARYDGDTPKHHRSRIRKDATVILSNPDMMHTAVLPYHGKWASFLSDLKYVVIDELHTYRGIFGSHMAIVIRRLRRLCHHYGSAPQFITCSATIANPDELATTLTGLPFHRVDHDGSARGEKTIVFWNPSPVRDDTMLRKSANVEAERLLVDLLKRNSQTIVFAKARVVAELIYKYARERLQRRHPELADRLRAYRGGYLPQQRREIEQALFSGELLGCVSTNALELGIDVGSLDAAVLVGFPGTICSTWQQMGRSGRSNQSSLAIMLAYNDPIDQYLMRHPDYFLEASAEHGVADPRNIYILAAQLACAVFELPLSDEDHSYFGDAIPAVMKILAEDQKVIQIGHQWHWNCDQYPAASTNLRTISDDTFTIVCNEHGKQRVIGNVDSISAPELVYPQAIYLHDGQSYQVRSLDLEGKIATVVPAEVDYYTQPVLSDQCCVVATHHEKSYRDARVCFGRLNVTWQTVAFKKIRFHSMEVIGQAALDLPPQTLQTTGLWMVPPNDLLESLHHNGHKPIEAMVAVRNLMLILLPVLSMCDRRDISGQVNSSNLGVAAMFVYDRYPGGLGFSQKGFEMIEQLMHMCYQLLDDCPCNDGCPSCVGLVNLRPPLHQDPDLASGYTIPCKSAATWLLQQWVGAATVEV